MSERSKIVYDDYTNPYEDILRFSIVLLFICFLESEIKMDTMKSKYFCSLSKMSFSCSNNNFMICRE